MAISIDTIYQRVLTLANKENRGYITPQEFNLLANQAQMSIFESYFYTKNLREKQDADRSYEVDETDIVELLGVKLRPFTTIGAVTGGVDFLTTITGALGDSLARDVFQVGKVFVNGGVCEKVSINEGLRMSRSRRHSDVVFTAADFGVYSDSNVTGNDIIVYAPGVITSNVTAEYVLVPRPVSWAYVVVSDVALYNSSISVDFELHRSEEDTLTNKILELAGIVINKPGLANLASQRDAGETAFQNIK